MEESKVLEVGIAPKPECSEPVVRDIQHILPRHSVMLSAGNITYEMTYDDTSAPKRKLTIDGREVTGCYRFVFLADVDGIDTAKVYLRCRKD
jgi:hypothetical protein